MRAPPAPTLQNVLVSHPSHPQNTVATPDDLVAAAVLAADDSHDISRRRNMLSRFSRRWARISDSIWRRRNPSRRELTTPTNPLSNIRLRSSRNVVRSRQVIAPPVIKFDPSHAPLATSTDTDPSLNNKTSDHPDPQMTKPVKQLHDLSVRLPIESGNAESSLISNSQVSSHPQTTARQSPLLLQYTSPASSQVILSRERELRANKRAELLAMESAADDEVLDELAVSSMKEPSARRVRQVGAREDDDTLLQLPRVPSVSFPSASRADSEHNVPCPPTTSSGKSHTRPPKVRQLPRVSGLMPMRSARAPPNDHTSPSSSADRSSRSSRPASEAGSRTHSDYQHTFSPGRSPASSGQSSLQSSGRSRQTSSPQRRASDELAKHNDGVFGSESDDVSETRLEGAYCDVSEEDVREGDADFDDVEDDDGYSSGNTNQNGILTDYNDSFKRKPLHRLPTGMSSKDVEREMERAVVEIASDGGESVDSGNNSENEVEEGLCDDEKVSAEGQDNVLVREEVTTVVDDPVTTEQEAVASAPNTERVVHHGAVSGTRSPMKSRSRSDAHDERTPPDQGFLRRVSSSMRNEGSLLKTDFEGCTVASSGGLDKNRASRAQDVALFEDDYLSFQGFHNNPSEGRTHYSGMTALLRPKRISSVTDSLSEESEEGGAMRMRSESLSRHGMLRSGRLPRLRRKRSAFGEGPGHSNEDFRM